MKTNVLARTCCLAALFAVAAGVGSAFVGLRHDAQGWAFENEDGAFLSVGINNIRMRQYWPEGQQYEELKRGGFYDVKSRFHAPYDDWATEVKQRMNDWGFNTAGAWSSAILQRGDILYCHVLRMGWSGRPNRLVDLFDHGFEQYTDRVARAECAKRADDRHLLGYFLDNELPWYGRKAWRTGPDSLLTRYSELPARAPGRLELIAFLREHVATLEDLRTHFAPAADSWETLQDAGTLTGRTDHGRSLEMKWAGRVAERFYAVASAAVRRYDRHHLILGSRFSANAPEEVWQAAAAHCDVLSVNYYPAPGKPNLERWREVAAKTGKPILISETSLRATENRSGNRNTAGAGPVVSTQHERAAGAAQLLGAWLGEPHIVGVHWFEYSDQPPAGRSPGGENSNYGLVDIHDRPYDELLTAWRATVDQRQTARGSRFAPTP